ncbi:trypsin delta-like [Rhagoletis pomonella]|uniref:trypsin delta-like n=1 Tax=Rhagoletis pomonella TaxID=28610 RepID=UPI0017810FAA|nr:trypsin delta-like [Rhagoletis pomonella]
MFRHITLVALLTIAFSTGSANAGLETASSVPMPDGRIVGGTNATISQYPHQVSMRYNGRHRCGGSIYSSKIIVSASHCVTGVDASNLGIVAGTTLLSEEAVEVPVLLYVMHEKYSSINDYDVAILVLANQLTFNAYIQPIALAKERPEAGTDVIVTGWGTLEEGGNVSDQLQQVTVNVIDNVTCRRSYPFLVTGRMLCAGVVGGGKDACQGDSGGPLIVNNELLGIVSWGIGCARSSYPGVYASVPDLAEWIEETAEAYNDIKEYSYL